MKKILLLPLLFLAVACCNNTQKTEQETVTMAELIVPAREAGQKSVLKLAVDPIPTVRVAFVGTGMRGSDAVRRFTFIDGTEIKAICDLRQESAENAAKHLATNGRPAAELYYGDAEAWKKVCDRDDIDLVYICTHWALHTPIAKYAMEKGKHVAIEVPAAMTLEECWDLVNTAEKTQRHCMMLENCTYDFFESSTLNMAQQGVFGELVHAEGAYIHDLRSLYFNEKDGYWDMWRLKHNEKHTGDPYPTHGLGPVCQAMNIHRGDRMTHLVALGSDQFGMSEYAADKFGKDSEYAKKDYKLGDHNTTLIRTAKGKSIMVQHDVTSPRPYSRIHMLSGTKGFAQKYPAEGIALEPNAHTYVSDKEKEDMLKKYQFPFVEKIEDQALKVGGHGGMDFIMDYRLIYCLQNGLPLDMDVYDAAEWCAIIPLSEASIDGGNIPVAIPDFTRGDWEKLKGLTFAE